MPCWCVILGAMAPYAFATLMHAARCTSIGFQLYFLAYFMADKYVSRCSGKIAGRADAAGSPPQYTTADDALQVSFTIAHSADDDATTSGHAPGIMADFAGRFTLADVDADVARILCFKARRRQTLSAITTLSSTVTRHNTCRASFAIAAASAASSDVRRFAPSHHTSFSSSFRRRA